MWASPRRGYRDFSAVAVGGPVPCRGCPVELRAWTAPERVLVVVRDRGSGPSDLAGTYRCRTVIGKTDSIQLTFSAGTGSSAAALEEPAAQVAAGPLTMSRRRPWPLRVTPIVAGTVRGSSSVTTCWAGAVGQPVGCPVMPDGVITGSFGLPSRCARGVR